MKSVPIPLGILPISIPKKKPIPMPLGYGYRQIRVQIGLKIPKGYSCRSLFLGPDLEALIDSTSTLLESAEFSNFFANTLKVCRLCRTPAILAQVIPKMHNRVHQKMWGSVKSSTCLHIVLLCTSLCTLPPFPHNYFFPQKYTSFFIVNVAEIFA